jgi:hypothetical protein
MMIRLFAVDGAEFDAAVSRITRIVGASTDYVFLEALAFFTQAPGQ